VAQHAGIKPTTIRFYESIGVLPPAHRVNGHRVYGTDILDRLTLIRFGPLRKIHRHSRTFLPARLNAYVVVDDRMWRKRTCQCSLGISVGTP